MITRHFAHVNGIRLRYVESGDGPPIVFLHGFPDFSFSWRHQFPMLSAAGYRCIAPDLRGYNESDKPRRVQDYAIGELVADVAELIEKTAGGSAYIVGHDWGGIIAWHVAIRHPALVMRLIILNAPHPALFRRELHTVRQAVRSWYAGFFQLPAVPEALFRAANRSLLRRVLASGPAGHDDVLGAYLEAFADRDALRAALDYYRAFVRFPMQRRWERVQVPTLVVWGERDP